MTLNILAARDRIATPWKNGGGVTREIAAHPAGAGMDGFEWRVSTAVVATEGPFSRFPGIDRILLVLAGAGLGLSIDGAAPVVLTDRSPPLPFPADVPVDATLVGGEVTDLNIMVRRGAWSAKAARQTLETELTLQGEDGVLLAMVQGRTACSGATLEPGDMLQLEAGDVVVLAPLDGPCPLIIITLSRAQEPFGFSGTRLG